jgi:hypothetical protein
MAHTTKIAERKVEEWWARPSGNALLRSRDMQVTVHAARSLFVVWVCLLAGFGSTVMSSTRADAQEVRCPSFKSAEDRLLMEQWAPDGNCRHTTKARVLDQFLGFTCFENKPEAAVCRAYFPGADSRKFDPNKHFRCLDVDLTATDDGVIVTQMREWIAPAPHQCDYSDLNIPGSDIDFANSQVCISGLCLPIARLTSLGKYRLRLIIERAFRELGLISKDNVAQMASLKPGRMRLVLPAQP